MQVLGKNVFSFILLLALFAVLIPDPPLGAAPLPDPDVCPSGCAFSSIQAAIDNANTGAVIWVGNGTYTENINFTGKAITVRSISGAENTTIDGGRSGSVVTFNSGEVSNSVLKGFTITNGWADYGGGIYILISSPTITDCVVRRNYARESGGGIYVVFASPTISDCIVSENSSREGGGINITIESSPTITNSTINGNEISSFGYGGGIAISGGSTTITNSTISGNKADSYGGGINIWSDSTSIANCTISGNSGGGIYIDRSEFDEQRDAVIVNSILWGNDSYELFLDYYVDPSAVTIDYTNVQDGWPGIGNINMDPLFVSSRSASDAPTTAGNYHLRQGSPAIDSGTVGGVSTYMIIPEDDIDGDTRPQGAGFDMGSDEYKEDSGIYPVDEICIFRSGAWLFYDYGTGGEEPGVWTGSSPGCIPATLDYDGDGEWEFSQFCSGAWQFYNDDGSFLKGIWTGGAGDLPVPADYDGDGTDDIVVFRNGAWLAYSFDTGQLLWSVWTGAPQHWNVGTPIPVPMDYDGDGTADLTVYSGGPWHFYNDNGSYNKGIWTGGVPGDIPVATDYIEDRADEVVVFRGGAWLFYDFDTGAEVGGIWTGSPAHWTGGTSLPAPLDYDGDGAVDLTVYSGGPWHFFNFDGTYNKGIWTGGVTGDMPISRRLLP